MLYSDLIKRLLLLSEFKSIHDVITEYSFYMWTVFELLEFEQAVWQIAVDKNLDFELVDYFTWNFYVGSYELSLPRNIKTKTDIFAVTLYIIDILKKEQYYGQKDF